MNPKIKTILIHGGLFLVTLCTTTLAGSEWTYGRSIFSGDYTWVDFASGLPYSITFILILTVHEFGHYFTAMFYKVRSSLPYFIPLPPMPFSFGTLGAMIRIRERIQSTQQNFDIGIAGPLAGFVLALGVLLYSYSNLPPPEYIYQFHPEYEQYGPDYAQVVYARDHMPPGTVDPIVGRNLMFVFLEKFVADPARVPNPHELIHYPLIFAAFWSLVFTSMNLLPIGQLDGGHVLYGLFGFRIHRIVASVVFCAFLFYAGLGVLAPGEEFDISGFKVPHLASVLLCIGAHYLCLGGLKLDRKNTLMIAVIIFAAEYFSVMAIPGLKGYAGWLLFAFIIGRFVSIPYPQAEIEAPLTLGRKILGWIALLIFILCFTPAPLEIIVVQ